MSSIDFKNDSITINQGAMTEDVRDIEDLYQAFKERFLEELVEDEDWPTKDEL